mgnify:CR=1 FL=1
MAVVRPLKVVGQLLLRHYIIRITMSFQAYLDNIEAKTGKSPSDFIEMAESKGFTENGKIKSDVKATQITDWLKQEFELGHGHAMAIYALLKGKRR